MFGAVISLLTQFQSVERAKRWPFAGNFWGAIRTGMAAPKSAKPLKTLIKDGNGTWGGDAAFNARGRLS
jgi:hypothetical protein